MPSQTGLAARVAFLFAVTLLFVIGTAVCAMEIFGKLSVSQRASVYVTFKFSSRVAAASYSPGHMTLDTYLARGLHDRSEWRDMREESERFVAIVGASRPVSPILGRRRGGQIWFGRMVIVAQCEDNVCRVALIENVPLQLNLEIDDSHVIHSHIGSCSQPVAGD